MAFQHYGWHRTIQTLSDFLRQERENENLLNHLREQNLANVGQCANRFVVYLKNSHPGLPRISK